MIAGTTDVVKTNRVWSPIYNTLETLFAIEKKFIADLHKHTHTHSCIIWNK